MNAHAQLIPVDTAIAVPLMWDGYISDVTTNIRGERESTKKPVADVAKTVARNTDEVVDVVEEVATHTDDVADASKVVARNSDEVVDVVEEVSRSSRSLQGRGPAV